MHHFQTLFSPSLWTDIGVTALLLVLTVAAGGLAHAVLFRLLGGLARRAPGPWPAKALGYARRPGRLLLPLFILNLVAPSLRLPERPLGLVNHAATILFIAAAGYLLINLVRFLGELLLSRHDLNARDNLRARTVFTQIKLLEKVLFTVVGVATASFILMTFDGVRQVGVSLLASAGIAGLVIGLAAQKSIATLLAGIQIAVTQPIRVDDVVIVEGEWGRVEEITLTYVVVRIWDLRRLVVPITYFIERPFQNWTRVSADLLGTVFLYTDYTVPVEEVRAEFVRVLKDQPLWDGKVCVTQVTDSKPDVLEIRLLLSTRNSGEGWELRCIVREHMVSWLQRHYPAALPRTRVELGGPVTGPSGTAVAG